MTPSADMALSGRLCGAFLIDEAFERHMREDSGLKFSRCESPTADFRSFVNAEWELTMKRVFAGDDFQDDYHIKPPLKAFSRMARLKGTTGEYTLKRYEAPLLGARRTS